MEAGTAGGGRRTGDLAGASTSSGRRAGEHRHRDGGEAALPHEEALGALWKNAGLPGLRCPAGEAAGAHGGLQNAADRRLGEERQGAGGRTREGARGACVGGGERRDGDGGRGGGAGGAGESRGRRGKGERRNHSTRTSPDNAEGGAKGANWKEAAEGTARGDAEGRRRRARRKQQQLKPTFWQRRRRSGREQQQRRPYEATTRRARRRGRGGRRRDLQGRKERRSRTPSTRLLAAGSRSAGDRNSLEDEAGGDFARLHGGGAGAYLHGHWRSRGT